MALIPSRAEIKVNGQLLPTRPRAALDVGGLPRAPVTTDQPVIDHTEEVAPARVVATCVYKPGLDLNALRNLTGAVVTYRFLPNGPVWRITDAFNVRPFEVANGEFPIELNGNPAEQQAASS